MRDANSIRDREPELTAPSSSRTLLQVWSGSTYAIRASLLLANRIDKDPRANKEANVTWQMIFSRRRPHVLLRSADSRHPPRSRHSRLCRHGSTTSRHPWMPEFGRSPVRQSIYFPGNPHATHAAEQWGVRSMKSCFSPLVCTWTLFCVKVSWLTQGLSVICCAQEAWKLHSHKLLNLECSSCLRRNRGCARFWMLGRPTGTFDDHWWLSRSLMNVLPSLGWILPSLVRGGPWRQWTFATSIVCLFRQVSAATSHFHL